MTSEPIRLDRPMRKSELIKHLDKDHVLQRPIENESHRWTMDALKELHFLIHLGRGR